MHYTWTLEIVGSILELGFLLVPNPRELIKALLRDPDFGEREPQDHGMVCFTELPIWRARRQTAGFGRYGVAVTWEWAKRHGARRVTYVPDHGPEFRMWSERFCAARSDLARRAAARPDGWWDLAVYSSHPAAVLGATAWSAVLQEYEYMQTDRHAAEAEWRVVQSLPFSFSTSEHKDQIEEALSMARMWRFTAVKLTPADVRFLVAPRGEAAALRDAVPRSFGSTPIREVT